MGRATDQQQRSRHETSALARTRGRDVPRTRARPGLRAKPEASDARGRPRSFSLRESAPGPDTPAQGPGTDGVEGADVTARPPSPRPYDRPGLKRDIAYFFGYQFVAVGLINLWPREETNYDSAPGWQSWKYNVTHPHWDQDRAVVNYVLHPYWGAGYYVRGRERGLQRSQAFWYSALLSTVFELGAEAMVEQVSYQDLLVTPILGSLLGEYVFWPLRERILAQELPLSMPDRLMLILTDPLGSINSAVDGLLGVKSQVSFGPMMRDETWLRRFQETAGPVAPPRPCSPCRTRWGVQLRLQW
jgi:hypothetical protein